MKTDNFQYKNTCSQRSSNFIWKLTIFHIKLLFHIDLEFFSSKNFFLYVHIIFLSYGFSTKHWFYMKTDNFPYKITCSQRSSNFIWKLTIFHIKLLFYIDFEYFNEKPTTFIHRTTTYYFSPHDGLQSHANCTVKNIKMN